MENNLELAGQLAAKDLQLHTNGAIAISNYDKLVQWLAEEIQALLDHDFEKLLNMLYRIDVSERKAGEALSSDDPALSIAKLVIERELQKVETRMKYKP